MDGRVVQSPLVGIFGRRLEVDLHAVSVDVSVLTTLTRCCGKAGLRVGQVFPSALASARSVTTSEERRDSVFVIDMGAGTIDFVGIIDDAVVASHSLPRGARQAANALETALGVSPLQSRRLLREHGLADLDATSPAPASDLHAPEHSQGATSGAAKVSRVLQAWMRSVLNDLAVVIEPLQKSKMEPVQIVLTGGMASMPGVPLLVEHHFGIPARFGQPIGLGGLYGLLSSPRFAVAAGLLQLSADDYQRPKGRLELSFSPNRLRRYDHGRWWRRALSWLY